MKATEQILDYLDAPERDAEREESWLRQLSSATLRHFLYCALERERQVQSFGAYSEGIAAKADPDTAVAWDALLEEEERASTVMSPDAEEFLSQVEDDTNRRVAIEMLLDGWEVHKVAWAIGVRR